MLEVSKPARRKTKLRMSYGERGLMLNLRVLARLWLRRLGSIEDDLRGLDDG
jgi:hypothetical protein